MKNNQVLILLGWLAEEIQPTLVAVLSDINMPRMDGLEWLGEIKQRRPNLPVMMVTAYGDDERQRRARELHLDHPMVALRLPRMYVPMSGRFRAGANGRGRCEQPTS